MIKRNPEIVLRKVGDFYFLIDPHRSYNSENEDIFQTNEIGAAIWNLLKDYCNVSEVYTALLELLTDEVDYDMQEQIQEDIVFFINQLKQNGFVDGG